MKIIFYKTPEMHDGHFSKEYLIDRLTYDNGLADENFMHNVVGEHYEGSAGFVMYIDGQPVLGNEKLGFSFALNGVLRGLNNAFYDVIKTGEGEFNLHVYSGVQKNIIKLKRSGDKVCFLGPEPNPVVDLNGKITELKQAAGEVINIIQEYKEIWRQVITDLQPSLLKPTMECLFNTKKKIFNNGALISIEEMKKDDRESFEVWLPLEDRMKELK